MRDVRGTPFDLEAWLHRQGVDGVDALDGCQGAPWLDVFLLSESQVERLMKLGFPALEAGRQAVAVRVDPRGIWAVKVIQAERGVVSGFTGVGWLMGPDGQFVATHCNEDDDILDMRLGLSQAQSNG
jgi:hypothetical protein